MEGKVFGVPLVLILLVVFIALLVDVPMVLLNNLTQKRLTTVENSQVNTLLEVRHALVTPTVEPTATPSATPTTVLKSLRSVVTPHVTVQVK